MKLKALAAAVTLLMSGHAAQAGLLETFYGVGASGTTAENLFKSALTIDTLRSDSLEAPRANTVAPVGMSFLLVSNPAADTGLTGSLTGGGVVTTAAAATGGRAPKDGTKFWQGATDPFAIEFTNAVAAFGFWGSDIGDFASEGCSTCSFDSGVLRITLEFDGPNAPAAKSFDLAGDTTSGSQLFWGFADSTGAKVRKVTFTNLTNGIDGQGFDLFQIGAVAVDDTDPNPTPEPGMLALAGLGLAAVAGVRRRRT
jgi:MYXO-CTERM domain-containing protein